MELLTEIELQRKTPGWLKLNGIPDRLELERTALLVCDMQNDFLLADGAMPVWGGPAIISNVNRLIHSFRATKRLIVFTQHHCIRSGIERQLLRPGSIGAEVHESIDCGKEDLLLVKYTYSAMFDTALPTLLRMNQIGKLVVTGVASNICCQATAHHATFFGLDVIFPVDATGGTSESAHTATLENIHDFYGMLSSTDRIVDSCGESL